MKTKKINVKLNDWKIKIEPIYYSRAKRAWYCRECKLYTESPRAIALHADEHSIKLPNSRPQSKELKINQNENFLSDVENIPDVLNSEEIEDEYKSNLPYVVPVEGKKERIWKHLMSTGELLKKMRYYGLYSEGELMEEKIISLFLLRQEAGVKTNYELMRYMLQ